MAGTSVLRFGVEREEQGAGRLDARLGAVVRRDQNASVRGGVAGVKPDGESVRMPEGRAAIGRLSNLAYGNRSPPRHPAASSSLKKATVRVRPSRSGIVGSQ